MNFNNKKVKMFGFALYTVAISALAYEFGYNKSFQCDLKELIKLFVANPELERQFEETLRKVF